jgi:hypothetical protein
MVESKMQVRSGKDKGFAWRGKAAKHFLGMFPLAISE